MAKYITVDALKGTLEKIKADISAISTDGFVTTEALTTALEGYIKEIPAEYVTEDELTAKGYLTEDALTAKGYLTAVPAEYVTDDELTAKGYLTAVPAEYVTEEELTAKGYLTTVAEATSEEVLALYTGTAQAQG